MTEVINEWAVSGVEDYDELEIMVRSTLSYIQYGKSEMTNEVVKCLKWLIDNRFMEVKEGTYYPTLLGKMVSLFYIKPQTGLHFKIFERETYKTDMSDIDMICGLLDCEEFLENIGINEQSDGYLLDLYMKEVGKYTNAKLMKAIPMIFRNYFEKKYNTKITLPHSEYGKLKGILNRLLASANVIIFDKEICDRIKYIKTMIKTQSLNRGIAELLQIPKLGNIRVEKLINSNIDSVIKFMNTGNKELSIILRLKEPTILKIKKSIEKL